MDAQLVSESWRESTTTIEDIRNEAKNRINGTFFNDCDVPEKRGSQ